MKIVEMSKIGNRVELFAEDRISPITIKIGQDSLVESLHYDDGNYILTLKNGETIKIEPSDIINDYAAPIPYIRNDGI